MSRRWIAAVASAALVAVVATVVAVVVLGDGSRASARTWGTSSAGWSSVVYHWGHTAGAEKRSRRRRDRRGARAGNQLGPSPGGTPSPTTVPGIDGRVRQISTSNSDSYALTSSGAVYAWGAGKHGELGDGSSNLPKAASIAVRVQFPAGVKITSLPDPMPYDGGMAIDSEGDVWAWGNDASQQFCQTSTAQIDTPIELPLSDVTLAAGALLHTIYDAEGRVVSCGVGKNGQLGNGTSGASSQTGTPVAVLGLPSGGVAALTSSWGNAGVLMADGSYYDWGYNEGGQVGDGTTTEQTTAVQVSLPARVSQVSQGGSLADNGQTMALLSDGQLWEWGNGRFGQMGDGQTVNQPTPFPMTEPEGVHFVEVNSGGSTNYAIDRLGQLYAWGHNNWGQVGDGHKSGRRLIPVRDAVTLSQVSSTASEVAGLGVTGSAW